MEALSLRIPPQRSEPELVLPRGSDEPLRTLSDFLLWIETSKELNLCQEFKAQHDCYMPALTNRQILAREFIENQTSAAAD